MGVWEASQPERRSPSTSLCPQPAACRSPFSRHWQHIKL